MGHMNDTVIDTVNPNVVENDGQTREFIKAGEKRLTTARYYIMSKLPVVAAAMARMEFVTQCSTAPGQMPAASTDCHKLIKFDLRRLAGMTDMQAVFLLTHEVCHKMLMHGGRKPERTDGLPPDMVHQLKNVADDFIINKMVYDLLSEKVATKRPEDMFPASDTMLGEPIPATRDNFWPCMIQSAVEGRPLRLFDPSVGEADSGETIYAYLLDTMPPQPQQEPDAGGSDPDDKGDGEQGEQGDGGPQDGPAGQGPGQGQEPGQGTPQPREGQGGAPSLDDIAKAMAGRQAGDDSGLPIQPDPETGQMPTEADIAHEQNMTGQQVAAAAQKEQEKARGKASMWLQRLMDATKRPAINPRTLLERYVRRRTARTDYTLRKLRRIGMHFGMALPTLRSEQLGELIVAIDTSGSVSDFELSQYASDIKAVQQVMKPTATRVIYCDAAVTGEQVFKRGQKLALKPKGGGGTKIIPVFRHIADNKLKSDLILYLTDGHVPGRIPAKLKPKAPVVWLVYDGYKNFAPDFGDVVHVELKNKRRR